MGILNALKPIKDQNIDRNFHNLEFMILSITIKDPNNSESLVYFLEAYLL